MKQPYNIFGEIISSELLGCDELLLDLERILPSIKEENSVEPSVSTRKNPLTLQYELTGEGLHQSFICDDAINAVCGITSGIIGRYAQLIKDRLCFHTAAIIFDGKAFLVPSTYKSGKSSFCLAWLQAGGEILTDDAAVVDPVTRQVWSFGLPLCIRNSLLKGADEKKLAYVEKNKICSGKNLTYVNHSNVGATHSYPFGGWLFLSRQHKAELSVRAISPASVIQQIIWQNFARNMPPSTISKIAADLTWQYPLLYSSYSEADDVIPVLKTKLEAGVLQNPDEQSLTLISEFGQADQVSVLMMETGGIVSDDRKGRVYAFNTVALQFWYLLTSNANQDEITSLLGELYPDVPIEIVLSDLDAFKNKLIDLDLLQAQFLTDESTTHP